MSPWTRLLCTMAHPPGKGRAPGGAASTPGAKVSGGHSLGKQHRECLAAEGRTGGRGGLTVASGSGTRNSLGGGQTWALQEGPGEGRMEDGHAQAGALAPVLGGPAASALSMIRCHLADLLPAVGTRGQGLEAGSSKSGCPQGQAPSEAQGDRVFASCSFWWLRKLLARG